MIKCGMIHGRFQPFHNGHFEYLLQALNEADKVIIGITNPDPISITEVPSDSHRHLPDANPFSFYLRLKMIRQSILLDNRIQPRLTDVEIVPFPITKTELWESYFPVDDVVQFMVILDQWDEEKFQMFRNYGLKVIIFEGERHGRVSGTEVRNDIRIGNSAWRTKVPLGTMEVLEEWLRRKREGPASMDLRI